MHIPKTGGDSFQHDAQKFLPLGSTLVGNDEKSFVQTRGKVGDMVVLLRKPESHVLSQFMECAFDHHWGIPIVGEYESSHPSEAQFPHTGVNPSPVYGGFVEWLHHFESSSIAWDCYNPRTLQTTRSQINSESEHAPFPPHSTLTERLESLGAVLITEHYLASVCLFEYRAVGFFTPHCACTARSELKRSSHHDAHGVPKHSINDIDEKTLELIRSMTRDDAELYAAALARFKAEVHEVFAATGVDLLCEEEEQKGSSEKKIEVAADIREVTAVMADLEAALELEEGMLPPRHNSQWGPRDYEGTGGLVTKLLHMNGFSQARADYKCGVTVDYAGCNPLGERTCCEHDTCNAKLSKLCDGHDHGLSNAHTCNGHAWATHDLAAYRTHSQTPWSCVSRHHPQLDGLVKELLALQKN